MASLQGLEQVVGFQTDGGQIFEGVDDGVGDGQFGGVSGFQRQSGQVFDSLLEFGEAVFEGDFALSLSEDFSVVVGGLNLHSVGEWFLVHFLQQGDLGVTDFLSDFTDGVIFGDFNLSFNDLGGNGQGVEETDLRWIHSGGSWLHGEVDVGDHSCFGSGGDSVGLDGGFQFGDWLVGENQSDFLFEEGDEGLQFRVNFSTVVSVPLVIVSGWDGLGSQGDGLSDDGIFSDQKMGSFFLELLSGFLDLSGTDVNDSDENDLIEFC